MRGFGLPLGVSGSSGAVLSLAMSFNERCGLARSLESRKELCLYDSLSNEIFSRGI